MARPHLINLNHPFPIDTKLTDMVFPCRYYLVTSSICIALLQCIASAYEHCFWGLEIDGPGQSTTVGALEL
jgi:hypothetical protein